MSSPGLGHSDDLHHQSSETTVWRKMLQGQRKVRHQESSSWRPRFVALRREEFSQALEPSLMSLSHIEKKKQARSVKIIRVLNKLFQTNAVENAAPPMRSIA